LLFIEGRDIISSHRKGTPQYEEALNRLKNFTYAYGEGEEEEQERDRIMSIHENSQTHKSQVSAGNPSTHNSQLGGTEGLELKSARSRFSSKPGASSELRAFDGQRESR